MDMDLDTTPLLEGGHLLERVGFVLRLIHVGMARSPVWERNLLKIDRLGTRAVQDKILWNIIQAPGGDVSAEMYWSCDKEGL